MAVASDARVGTDVFGCPMARFDSPCYREMCPWFLTGDDGTHKCAVAHLCEGSRADVAYEAPSIRGVSR